MEVRLGPPTSSSIPLIVLHLYRHLISSLEWFLVTERAHGANLESLRLG